MKNNYSLYLPSVWEVKQAERVFMEYIQKHAYEAQYPPESQMHNSKEVIVQCALSAVWMAGRQHEHNISRKNLEE